MDVDKDKNIDKIGDENIDEGEDENMDNDKDENMDEDEDENIDNDEGTGMFTYILFNTISKHFFQLIEVHKQYKLVSMWKSLIKLTEKLIH